MDNQHLYLDDLAAHELHGPFFNTNALHNWAVEKMISTYQIVTRRPKWRDPDSLRPVPLEWRA